MHHVISSQIRMIIFNLIFKTVNSLKPELLSIIILYADISPSQHYKNEFNHRKLYSKSDCMYKAPNSVADVY